MSIRKITLASGTKLWQARVRVDGQRRSALRDTYEAATTAEAALRRGLAHEIAQAGAVAARPGTVRDGLRGYVARLEARGKSRDSVVRARQVEGALAGAVPGLLDRPVSSLTAEDLFAYKRARDRAGTAPSAVNRDAGVVRAMLKVVRPSSCGPPSSRRPRITRGCGC